MYYESRVIKIPRKYIMNSILKYTWLANTSINYCKPIDDEELPKLLDQYSVTKDANIKNKLYNGLVWYAAYIAYFMYIKYCMRYPSVEYEDYLSRCLERLMCKIDDWNSSKSNGASFYTRLLDDVIYSIQPYLNEIGTNGLCKRNLTEFAIKTMRKISYKGYTVHSAISLDPDTFKSEFDMTKERFLMYLKYNKLTSGNIQITNEDTIGDNGAELFDYVKDDYNSSFEDRVLSKVLSDKICDLAKTKFKDKLIYFLIWKDYKSGGYTYDSLAEKYYNGDRTRERIRQIINMVDDRIMHNPTYKDIKKAMDL